MSRLSYSWVSSYIICALPPRAHVISDIWFKKKMNILTRTGTGFARPCGREMGDTFAGDVDVLVDLDCKYDVDLAKTYSFAVCKFDIQQGFTRLLPTFHIRGFYLSTCFAISLSCGLPTESQS